MNDFAAQKVQTMIAANGPDVINLSGMCEILLKHHLGNDPLSVALLMLAVNNGIAKQIRDLSPEKFEKQYESLMHQLMSGTDLTPEEAHWILQTWANGFRAQPKKPPVEPVVQQKIERHVPEYNPGNWAVEPPPLHKKNDQEENLYFLLLGGIGVHVLTLILVAALGEFLLPKNSKKPQIYEGLIIAYGFSMVLFLFTGMIAFLAVNSMFKKTSHSAPLSVRFFSTWLYSSGAVYVSFFLTLFMPLYVSIWLALGLIAWTIQHFGFKTFVVCFVLFATHWVVIFLAPEAIVAALFWLQNPPMR